MEGSPGEGGPGSLLYGPDRKQSILTVTNSCDFFENAAHFRPFLAYDVAASSSAAWAVPFR